LGPQARKQKAGKYKDVGEPISLPGVPIDVKLRGNYAWVAESTHAARKVDLQVRLKSQPFVFNLIALIDGENHPTLQGPFRTRDISGVLRQSIWFWG
jgi:hypothetical protein